MAECPARRGVLPILGVDALDERAELIHRVERIRPSVEEQIGRVEVDAEVVGADVVERAEQRRRRFLAGLEPQLDIVIRAGVREPRERVYGARITRVVRVLGDEAHVPGKRRRADPLGKGRRLLERGQPHRACLRRDQPQRQRPFVEVPHSPARRVCPMGGDGDLVLLGRSAHLVRRGLRIQRRVVGGELAGWQVELGHAPDGCIRAVLQAGDDAQREWPGLIAGGAHGGTSGAVWLHWLCCRSLGIVPDAQPARIPASLPTGATPARPVCRARS